jgi:hypothetical protein
MVEAWETCKIDGCGGIVTFLNEGKNFVVRCPKFSKGGHDIGGGRREHDMCYDTVLYETANNIAFQSKRLCCSEHGGRD